MACLLALSVNGAHGEDLCDAALVDVPLQTTTATGSLWSHLLGRERSAKNQSERIISEALDALPRAQLPDRGCPAGCAFSSVPEVLFRSAPTRVLEEYDDKGYCRALLHRTEQHPFIYPEKAFQDLDEVISWFGDFSQGDGDDGEDLYSKCDRDCTPRYTVTVRVLPSGFMAGASVICGEARDKEEGTFKMETYYRFRCVSPVHSSGR